MGHALVVDSRRLFAAADALLKAMHSPEGVQSLIPVCVDSPMENRDAPTRAFAQTELLEAMSMLIRMGFTEPRSC